MNYIIHIISIGVNNNYEKMNTQTNGYERTEKFKTHMKHLKKYLNQCFKEVRIS